MRIVFSGGDRLNMLLSLSDQYNSAVIGGRTAGLVVATRLSEIPG